MKKANSRAFDQNHPLRADEDRLNSIADIMYLEIQQMLFPWGKALGRPRVGNGNSVDTDDLDEVLPGTAVGVEDILQEALIGLFQYPAERVEETWEALGVTIARYKAIDALRASRSGLRETERRHEINLVSGDVQREGLDGELEPAVFDLISKHWGEPEAEFFVKLDVLKLRDLAREFLNSRDQRIFFAIHFGGYSRQEVGSWFQLTSQRAGQIYNVALRTLEAHPEYPFKPTAEAKQLLKGGNDD